MSVLSTIMVTPSRPADARGEHQPHPREPADPAHLPADEEEQHGVDRQGDVEGDLGLDPEHSLEGQGGERDRARGDQRPPVHDDAPAFRAGEVAAQQRARRHPVDVRLGRPVDAQGAEQEHRDPGEPELVRGGGQDRSADDEPVEVATPDAGDGSLSRGRASRRRPRRECVRRRGGAARAGPPPARRPARAASPHHRGPRRASSPAAARRPWWPAGARWRGRRWRSAAG